MVEGVPEGVHIDFLRAERSLHRWHRDDVQRIRLAERIASREGAGVQMHILEDAGHWVSTPFLRIMVIVLEHEVSVITHSYFESSRLLNVT